jgi:hypothetical protein
MIRGTRRSAWKIKLLAIPWKVHAELWLPAVEDRYQMTGHRVDSTAVTTPRIKSLTWISARAPLLIRNIEAGAFSQRDR